MKTVYGFYADCGRMGSLEGLFVATPEEVENLYGKTIHFGEALGKHSEISLKMDESNFTKRSDDPEKVAWLISIFDSETTLCGYNPLDYYEECEDD